MGGRDLSAAEARLLAAPATAAAVAIGELIAITGDGKTPLVRIGSDVPVLRARSTVDLCAAHIGTSLVVAYEDGDAQRPIVIGLLRGEARVVAPARAPVVIETDGERLVVDAKQQLVLRCGKACITLTSAGKVLIEGSYISSRSTGVNRVKGGSVQLN